MTLKTSVVALGALLCSGAIALLAPLAAHAAVQKDVDGDVTYVWIDGLTPGGTYQYNINGINKTQAVTVNSCGWAQLSFSYGATPPSSVRIADSLETLGSGTTIATGSLPEQAKRCSNGVVTDPLGNPVSATTPFKDTTGKFIFPGYTQNARKVIEHVGVPDLKSRKADACGLVRFMHNPTTPSTNFSSFSWAGTSYSLASLPQVREVRCKTYKDGTSRKLVPTAL